MLELGSALLLILSMFYDVNTPRLFCKPAVWLALSAIVFPVAVHARIGETQDALEKRLLQPGLGKLFPRTSDSSKDKDKDRPKKREDDPLKDIRAFLPAETHEMVYWKSAVANQLSNETGWKVDVFYIGGRSTLEAYKRVGDSLSEFEIRGILSINRGNSSWKKVSNDGGGVNGIGYDYELEDGSMRAKQQDSWIIVFATKLDNYVMQQQVVAKAERDLLREQQKKEQALKAPESVAGF
ncbi:MAG TPA: hypothetical protein VL357_01350 [Rariglobus sp.]|nr:hypothetical protein [Rariglobus sp.]